MDPTQLESVCPPHELKNAMQALYRESTMLGEAHLSGSASPAICPEGWFTLPHCPPSNPQFPVSQQLQRDVPPLMPSTGDQLEQRDCHVL